MRLFPTLFSSRYRFQSVSSFLLATLVILLTVGNSSSFAQYGNQKMVIVSESLRPFEYLNDQGEPVGINVEITSTILESMDIPYEFNIQKNTGIRAMELAKEGKADAILSVSYKSDRESFLLYPKGFHSRTDADNFMWVSEYVCFIRKDDEGEISFSSLKQLANANYRIGVIDGVSYTPEFWNAGLNTIKGENERENFNKLLAGEIDMVITDRTIGRATIKSMGIRDQLEELNKKVFQKLYTMPMVKSSDFPNKEQFLEEFYKRLDVLKKSGKARDIYLKYIY
jgi:polar amino acid transport system substrate-binding protein